MQSRRSSFGPGFRASPWQAGSPLIGFFFAIVPTSIPFLSTRGHPQPRGQEARPKLLGRPGSRTSPHFPAGKPTPSHPARSPRRESPSPTPKNPFRAGNEHWDLQKHVHPNAKASLSPEKPFWRKPNTFSRLALLSHLGESLYSMEDKPEGPLPNTQPPSTPKRAVPEILPRKGLTSRSLPHYYMYITSVCPGGSSRDWRFQPRRPWALPDRRLRRHLGVEPRCGGSQTAWVL